MLLKLVREFHFRDFNYVRWQELDGTKFEIPN